MEVWLFIIGLIVGSSLCIVLPHFTTNLDSHDIYDEDYITDFKEYNNESEMNCNNMTNKKLKLTKEDIDTLITIICKKQLHMIKRDSCLYNSDKYNNLELLKAKLNNLYTDK